MLAVLQIIDIPIMPALQDRWREEWHDGLEGSVVQTLSQIGRFAMDTCIAAWGVCWD